MFMIFWKLYVFVNCKMGQARGTEIIDGECELYNILMGSKCGFGCVKWIYFFIWGSGWAGCGVEHNFGLSGWGWGDLAFHFVWGITPLLTVDHTASRM